MKKKFLLGILIALAVMCLFAISVSAAESEIGGFKYTTNSDGTATLSSNVSFTGTVAEIPETVEIDGASYTVTTIADNIFKGNTTVETISFPSTITKVGGYVITKCTVLKAVYIDLNNLVSVGTCALTYNGSHNGTNMTDNGANTGIYFYPTSEYGKENPTKTTVASFDNLTYAGAASFQGLNVEKIITSCAVTQMFRHSAVKEVVVNGELTSIGGYCFNACANLEKINVNSRSLTSIGSNAFGKNPAVKEIHIDLSKVTFIDGNAFEFSANAQGGNYNTVTKWYNLDGENIVDLSNVKTLGGQSFGTSNVGMAKIIWPNALDGLNDQVFRKANITGPVYIRMAEGKTATVPSYFLNGNSPELIVCGEGVKGFNIDGGFKWAVTLVFLDEEITTLATDRFKTSGSVLYVKENALPNDASAYGSNVTINTIKNGTVTTYGACGMVAKLTLADDTTKELKYVDHDYEGVVDQTVCPAGSLTVYTCAGCKDSYNEKTDDYIGAHNFDRANGAKVVDVVFANNNYFETGVIIVKCANCTQETNDEETVEALFSAGGYSLPEDGTTNVISHTIKVNKSAITKYEELTGKAINYGTVAAVGNALGNPLSVVNGEIKVATQALASDMSGTNYTKLVIKIAGVPNNTAVNCNAYVIIDSNITYVCGMEVSTKAKEVQLNIAE